MKMKSFKVEQINWENFICGKRKYLITSDDEVDTGVVKCVISNGIIADLFVTDIVWFPLLSGNVYVVTAEVNQVWL